MGWVGLVLFCFDWVGLSLLGLGWVCLFRSIRHVSSIFVDDVFDILVEFEFRDKSSSFFFLRASCPMIIFNTFAKGLLGAFLPIV